jgi:GT2 family glycosyltransferase/glycosyltransferase involved in cell wall biosynthesis
MQDPEGPDASIINLARSAMEQGNAALAAGDTATASRWLERAHRLVPHDPNVALALAGACLAADPARSASLFLDVARKHDIKQAWLGLAAARFCAGDREAAAAPLANVLSRHAYAPDIASLADRIAGPNGWCGLGPDGRLEIRAPAGAVRVRQDGREVRGGKLGPGWAASTSIDVLGCRGPLLGSPIQPGAIRRTVGCVEPRDGGVTGWAWHPADPDRHPELRLSWPAIGLERTIVADDESIVVPDAGPLARPRGFRLTPRDLPDRAGALHIHGPDGKPLLGSPLDPGAGQSRLWQAAFSLGREYPADPGQAGEPAGRAVSLRADAAPPCRPVLPAGKRRPVTVVIPVHDGGDVTAACIRGVMASLPADAKILVVDDGSSDPALVAALNGLASERHIRLLRHAVPEGFPASANAGIRAARGRDVVLLNSDTLLPPGWLDRLRDAAYSEPGIGTVTPLSNDATILSYPSKGGGNPVPDQAGTNRLDRLAQRANGGSVVDIPVGIGFCLYVRRDCLNAAGVFRADVFAQGYGEENDLCLRARLLGWRNVALTGLFVGHVGGASFGAAAAHLRSRNAAILERLHPGHDALIHDFIARDPLAGARRRIDLLRWRDAVGKAGGSVVLISHNDGGGVEQRVAASARDHRAAGRFPIVVRPAQAHRGESAVVLQDGTDQRDGFPNLIYALPRELPALTRLLRAARTELIEVHHFLDHGPAVYDLVTRLGVPYDVHAHDYGWVCPRLALVGRDRYCGEPDLHDCEACVADNGHFLKEDITVAGLRRRSAGFLGRARRVIVPSRDTAARLRRYFPDLPVAVVPHEDDAKLPPALPPTGLPGRKRVCVVGGIGLHKGYDVLLACARDAEHRGLDLEFVVVGNTIDDARMMATGRVFVTGRYRPDEAAGLIGRQQAALGFVASIWPETWCLTLSDIWRAGLPAVAFDIGAPAERIRGTGRGFLLPLGLSAGAINNALVAAACAAGHR